jgi:hypothetical protein
MAIDALSFLFQLFQSSELRTFLLLVMVIGTPPTPSFLSIILKLGALNFPIIGDGNQWSLFFSLNFLRVQSSKLSYY